MVIDGGSAEGFAALALGFALSGVLVTGFELLARRPLSFRMLQTGDLKALASVPMLVFSAPALIIRNTIRGSRIERRPIPYVMAATVIAGLWSIASGRLVFDIAQRAIG